MLNKKSKFILGFFLFFLSCIAYAATNIWDFSNSGDYSYSTAGSFSVSGGIAGLQEDFFHRGSISDTTNFEELYDVVVDGSYAYVTSYVDDKVSIVDISDPTNPSFVTSISNNGGTLRLNGPSGITKDGDYLYVVSHQSDALQIINVSNPASPTAAGQVLNSPTSNRLNGARGIVKSGNYVYIASQNDRAITIIDVSNPNSPSWESTIRETTNLRGTRNLAISGDYLYATSYARDRITSIDISDPSTPTLADSLNDGRLNGAWGIDISGNYAYVASYLDDSVQVVDISDPTDMSLVEEVNNGGSYSLDGARDIIIDGNTLYVSAYSSDAINAIDISDPLSLSFIDSISDDGTTELNGAGGMYLDGNRLYVAAYVDDGLEIVDFDYDSTSPYLIPNTSYDYTGLSLSAFSEILGGGNEGNITYQISKDDGSTWYYYNGGSWQTTTGGTGNSNSASVINTNILSFEALGGGTDEFTFKAFFNSDGSEQVELDSVSVTADPPSVSYPGGVSSNLQLWLKADEGTSTTTDGNSLSTWNDQSGNSYDATAVNAPTYRNNNSDNVNYNPVVDFDGSNDYMRNLSNGGYSDSYFLVVVPDQTVDGTITGQVPFGFDCYSGVLSSGSCGLSFAGLTLGAFTIAINDEVITHAIGSATSWRSAQIGVANYPEFKPVLISVNENSTGNGTDIYEKGVQINNYTANSYHTLSTADYSLGRSMDGTYPFYYNGKIAEVINYSSRLSDSDREQVEAYLSLKYGITLQSGTVHYKASDGTTDMWAPTSAGLYVNDIFGIGRDDDSGLGQVKSKTFEDDGVITLEAIGEGTNTSPSFSDISDLEFLTLANNNDGNVWSTTGSPSGYEILSRQWRVQEIGEVGTVQLDFDVANTDFDIPVLSAGTSYYFVYDSNNNNSLTDETPQVMTNTTGNIWRISGIDLDHLREFTIATQASTNNIPTDITLSNNTINENVAASTLVGGLTTTDADVLDTHTYSLIAGNGDQDNGAFNIIGSNLYITESPDYELQNIYYIRIETDDGNGGKYQKELLIYINNLSETVNSIIDFETSGKYTVTSGIWDRNTNNPQEGSYSIEVDNQGTNNSQSCFEITNTFSGTGSIDFEYSVSSESGSDYLRFYIDNIEQGSGWSGSIGWSHYNQTDITAGTHTYKWCYIKDGGGSSGTDNAWIDYIAYTDVGGGDTIDPTIVSTNFSSGSLLPGGDHNIIINYSDGDSGIDVSSDDIELYKWNGSTWGTDIAATGLDLGSKTITTTSATYPTDDLSSGKYRYVFSISDNDGNTAIVEIVFYIDIPELILSTGNVNLGSLPPGSLEFSSTEIEITVKTIGAAFDLTFSKDNDFARSGGNGVIVNWDGSEGVGYDQETYTLTNSDINTNPNLANEVANIDVDGVQQSYVYKIKIGTLINIQQAAGNYSTNLSFYLTMSY